MTSKTAPPGRLRRLSNRIIGPKPLVRASRLRVLFRCSTHHFVPVAACITLLYMNLRTVYLGNNLSGTRDIEDTTKLQALQLAAKAHEITMVASMAMAVFDFVRYRLLYSERGIPLGLVGSGLLFTDASFLISKPFWKAFKSSVPIMSKIAVGLLAVLFCVLANTVGPASAMLMIPSNQTWSTAVYNLSLNGSADDLWPSTLLGHHIGPDHCKSSTTALSDPNCVGGGYSSLLPYFENFKQYPAQFAFTMNTQDALSKRRSIGNIRNDWEYGSESWTQSTHVGATTVAESVRSQWANDLRFLAGNKKWTDICTARMKTTVPVVRTACVPMTNLKRSPSGRFHMAFPVLPEYAFWYWPRYGGSYGTGPTANMALDNSLLRKRNRSASTKGGVLLVDTHWVTLPKRFGSTSTGLVMLFSETKNNDDDFSHGVSCAVDARWSKGENSITTAQTDWAWAAYSQPMQSSVSNRRTPYDNYGSKRLFLPVNDGSWRRVSMSTDWTEALTPEVEDAGTSSLGAILQDKIPSFLGNVDMLQSSLSNGSHAAVPMLEHVLATMVSDGMARVGSYLQPSQRKMKSIMDSIPQDKFSLGSPEVAVHIPVGDKSTSATLETEVVGYGYKISGGTGYFAAAALLLYMLVALTHTFVAVWYGVSSSAWEDVSDLLGLAMSSRFGGYETTTPKPARDDSDDVVITALLGLDEGSRKVVALVRSGERVERVKPGEVYGTG